MFDDHPYNFDIDSFNKIYSHFLRTFKSCKREKISYFEARLKTEKKIENKYHPNKNLPTQFTTDLLKKSRYNWIHEKPPLTWYAAVNTAYIQGMNFSPELMCMYAAASNYYGDFERAQQLSSCALELLSNDYNSIHFEATKQLAKALKNNGDFDKSQLVLREAFCSFSNQEEQGYIAYLYMLYAKLCNDYQQREGWYQSFHFIANTRILNSKFPPAKWIEICNESFAKSNFNNDPRNSLKIYSQIVSRTKKKNDSYVRQKAHLYEATIVNSILNQHEQKNDLIDFFNNELEKYWNLIGIAEKLGNIKAVCVRQAHFLRLARKVELWRQSYQGTGNDKIAIITDLVNGEAIRLISSATNIAFTINDWRTQAVLKYEKGMWLSYIIPASGTIEMFKRDKLAEECFVEGLSILKKPKYTLAFLYYLVLMELGKVNINKQNWSQARSYFKECYQHCKHLIHTLQLDEESLQRSRRTECVSCNMIELCMLKTRERERVNRALMKDYKVLTSRSMWIAEQLSELSFEQITKWTANFYSTSWRSRHHNLTGKLRKIKAENSNHPSLVHSLDEIEGLVNKWSAEDIGHLRVNTIDLINEVKTIIETSIFVRDFKDQIIIKKNANSKVYIQFNIEVLRIIIENLVSNIAELGSQLDSNWKVKISFDISNDMVSIDFSDNLGCFEKFSSAIELVNQFKAPKSSKRSGNGKGLLLVKELILTSCNNRNKWILVQENNWKTLRVPLSEKRLDNSLLEQTYR
ncbi:MAG: ATP-binding protein [Desulfosarcina sp.]|nr:ATP-binding protein [Desulfobacterales bacterium]